MNIILHRNNSKQALVPFYRPLSLLDEVDKLSREIWDSWRPFTFEDSLAPHTDMYEEKGQLVIKTELPGIDKKDLDISLEGDKLTIKAEKKEEVKEDTTHHTRERYYGQYFHSVTLPYPVKENKINATFENGVLELRLPKAEEAKAKKIEIKAQLSEGEPKKRGRKPKQKKS
ncbi:Hsp20/alpha crystallin family protein [Chloroflexota bacterium]